MSNARDSSPTPLPRLLSDEQFIARLVEAGYTEQEAAAMLKTDLADAAEEDGYDGP